MRLRRSLLIHFALFYCVIFGLAAAPAPEIRCVVKNKPIHELDSRLFGDGEAGVDGGRRRSPVLVQFEARRPRS